MAMASNKRLRSAMAAAQLDIERVASALAVDPKTVQRWLAGRTPRPRHRWALASLLGVDDEAIWPGASASLAGQRAARVSYELDVSGAWWTGWQSYRGGIEDIRVQPVRVVQRGDQIRIEATARGRPVEEGGYLWCGELRLWDNGILMGWYAAADGSVRSKGTMYFVVHPHGISMSGRWVGLSYDGQIVTGWGSMAKSEEEALAVIGKLKEQETARSE